VAATLNEQFIPVRLEGRGHMDLVQKFGVRGAPTTIVFTADGKEIGRFVGFQGPEEYLAELKKAR
jgi:thioredoxin-related protein